MYSYSYAEYKKTILELLCKKYGIATVIEIVVQKINGKKADAICFQLGTNVASPIVYFEMDKERYTDEDVKSFIKKTETKYELAKQFTNNRARKLSNWNDVKDKIYPQLMNYEINKKALQKIPHVKFLDMAVGFFCNTTRLFPKTELGAMTVNTKLKMTWGVTDEELMESAMSNLKKLPFDMKTLEEVAAVYGATIQTKRNSSLYMLTVYTGMFGAAVLLNNEFLKEVCNKLKCSKLWIIASSVHEIMVLPFEYAKEAFHVHETSISFNEIIEPDDILSESLYIFDVEKGKLEIYERDKNGQT